LSGNGVNLSLSDPRLAVGIEGINDLVADFAQALA
jgi:O-acetylhomoserine/O-acetylserine sulfhydrylase-like pyridoxal-dependent enzyme